MGSNKRAEDHLRQCAYLDAQGTPLKDLATAMDRTRSTIANWRKLPEYQQHVRDYSDVVIQQIEPLVNRNRVALLQLEEDVREAIYDLLHAVDDDGDPLWWARKAGIEMFIRHPAVSALYGVGSVDTQVNLNQVIRLQLVDTRPGEVIEGELVESEKLAELMTGEDVSQSDQTATSEEPLIGDGTAENPESVEVNVELPPEARGAEEAPQEAAAEDHLGDGSEETP